MIVVKTTGRSIFFAVSHDLPDIWETLRKFSVVEEDSKSPRRYVSARFADTWFYIQLQIRHLLNALAELLANN